MSASGFLLLLISAMIGCAAVQEDGGPCVATEKNMEENNIKLKGSNAKTLNIPHGDGAEFECKPGYEIRVGTHMRGTCENGKMDYPKCYNKGRTMLYSDIPDLFPFFYITNDYQENQAKECQEPAKLRRQCGFDGISFEDCRRRDCCIHIIALGEISCFHPKSQDEAHCSVSPFRRSGCGEPVTSARQCLDRGCCFDSSLPIDKGCYAPEEPTNECGGPIYLRRQCGSTGISAEDCRRRDCCYDSSLDTNHVMKCFFKRSQNTFQCAVRPLDRKQCGHLGMTAKECYTRGCCFDSSIPGGLWCYSPAELK